LGLVQQELALSEDQVMALIINGDLPAVKVLGMIRVERMTLEHYICRLYINTALELRATPDASVRLPDGSTDRQEDASSPPGRNRGRQVGLTPQMQRVLELVAQGRSNAEIAEELSVEVSTVKSHVSRLLSRLDCRDRENLIAFAWRSRLVRSEDAEPTEY